MPLFGRKPSEPERASEPGVLGAGQHFRTSFVLDDARRLTVKLAEEGRGREYPLLPRVVPAAWEWRSEQAVGWHPPALVETFKAPEDEDVLVFVAYWPHAGGTDLSVAGLTGFSRFEAYPQLHARWRSYDPGSIEVGRSPTGVLRIATPRVPPGIVEQSLEAAGVPHTVDNWAEAARMIMTGYLIRTGQIIDNLARGGRLPSGSHQRFLDACPVDSSDVVGSFQNVFNVFASLAPDFVYLAQDFPWRVPAVMLLEPENHFNMKG